MRADGSSRLGRVDTCRVHMLSAARRAGHARTNAATVHNDARASPRDRTDCDRSDRPRPVRERLPARRVHRAARASRRCWWHEPTEHTPDGEGFWSVHTHAECMAVVHDPVAYSSETGGDRPYGGTTLHDLPVAGLMLNMMDDPRHQRVRLLVSKGLTPRTIARLEDDLRAPRRAARRRRARRGHLRLRDRRSPASCRCRRSACCSASRKPTATSCSSGSSTASTSTTTARPSRRPTRSRARPPRCSSTARTLIAEKRAHPADDMLSVVCHATLAGEEPPRAHRSGAAVLLQPVVGRGRRHDTQRDRGRGRGALRVSRPAGSVARGARRDRDRRRGDRALDASGRVQPPHGDPRRRARRPHDRAPATRSCSGRRRRTATSSCSRSRSGSTCAATRTRISGSATACTTASARTSRGSRSGSCSSELLVRVDTIELAGPVEWTRSNKHTGIRRLPVHAHRG